jgi:GxxExxY protein
MGMRIEAIDNVTTSGIIGAAIDVHRMLGPGLLESIYAGCLKRELGERKLRYVSERSIPVVYRGTTLDVSYRIDLIVEDRVIVEVKSVATVLPVHEAQLLTYLKLTACPIGLLINFNEAKLVDGVHRLVNPA